jgi:hypothetical protein
LLDRVLAHKIALPGFLWRILIAVQVLDGPPGDATRRPSSFLLIPVGSKPAGICLNRLAHESLG